MIDFRLAIREIIGNSRFSLFFILNLSLGLCGFVALDAFKFSIEDSLSHRSKSILAADLSVSARRPLIVEELERVRQELPQQALSTQVTEVFSMVTVGKVSRLVQLKAIEPSYPFYGELELRSAGTITGESKKSIFSSEEVWVYPEVLVQLGVKLGDQVKLGDKFLRIADVVEKDSVSDISTSMAPRIFLSRDNLATTNLLRKGSTAWHTILYRLPADVEIADVADRVFSTFEDPGIKVTTYSNASRQLSRLLGYLNDYLGLTSLAALFLAGLGVGFLFRMFVAGRTKEVAIMRSLGVTSSRAQRIYVLQLLLLGLISLVPTLAFVQLVLPWLAQVGGELMPQEVELAIPWQSIAVAAGLATVGSFLICWPQLHRLSSLSPSQLFQDAKQKPSSQGSFKWLPYLCLLLVFWLLAIWQANSLQVGSLFYVGFLGSAGSLFLVGWIILGWLGKRNIANLPLRIISRNLVQYRMATLSCFLAMGLGVLLLNLVPQIQAGLKKELEGPQQSKLPSLFFFDIQEEQLQPLVSLVAENGVQLQNISPLVRARISGVNGESFVKGNSGDKSLTREQEREKRFRNRGFNLTFRESITDAEEIIEGRDFSGHYDEENEPLAEVSVEVRFAERLGFKMGDEVTFDVQSVPVKSKIVNFRRVKWASFQPNFFVQFQPGVLDMAPKTFLASTPPESKEKKMSLQNDVVARFSNISIIDVSRLVKIILGVIEQMGVALQFMAMLAILVGFIVLVSIANHQIRERRWDINLLKVLGASFAKIRLLFVAEFVLISSVASLLGGGLSLVFSYVVSSYLFDSLWAYNLSVPSLSVFSVVTLSALIAFFVVRGVLRQSASQLLS